MSTTAEPHDIDYYDVNSVCHICMIWALHIDMISFLWLVKEIYTTYEQVNICRATTDTILFLYCLNVVPFAGGVGEGGCGMRVDRRLRIPPFHSRSVSV